MDSNVENQQLQEQSHPALSSSNACTHVLFVVVVVAVNIHIMNTGFYTMALNYSIYPPCF